MFLKAYKKNYAAITAHTIKNDISTQANRTIGGISVDKDSWKGITADYFSYIILMQLLHLPRPLIRIKTR
jgi:hypothetical protein